MIQTRYYDMEKVDDFDDDFSADNSTMNKEVEQNLDKLIVASSTVKKRKPIYDFETKNKTFIELYNDLYKLGIKNNKFVLRLYDPDLKGISPYQPILPIDMQIKILYECIINPWYWLREVCRIPEDGAPIEIGGGTQYKIDRNNLAAWYLFLNGIDHYQSKPRQTGKTQDAVAKQNYAFHYGTLSANFLFFNKDQALAKQNLYRLKCQRDMMPSYMQMRYIVEDGGKVNKGIDNITTMRNPITNNTILVMPKATSKDSAIKLGRGNTAAFHYYDEADFTPWIEEIINAAAFSYSTASKNARNNGSLYGRIYTSTPKTIYMICA